MKTKSPLLLIAMLWLAATLSSQADGLSFGAWRWSADFGAKTINLKFDSISNNRASGYTGTLRLELWATNYPITDAPYKGWKMGYHQIKRLDAGKKIVGINMTVPLLSRPSAGAKYVTLVVTEFKGEGSGYVRQIKSSSLPHTFK